jgi:site-specific DNA-adenine methylase
VIEPFVGTGDLLKFIDPAKTDYTIETYDIDPKYEGARADAPTDPPDYTGKFVLTNPPYLAQQEQRNKEIYENSGATTCISASWRR